MDPVSAQRRDALRMQRRGSRAEFVPRVAAEGLVRHLPAMDRCEGHRSTLARRLGFVVSA
jgi:hypothetical protein